MSIGPRLLKGVWLAAVIAALWSTSAAAQTAPIAASYRLGTAARPFGWSTAVADFNADGTPDVAIADRSFRHANGYNYRIQLRVSGERERSVVFDSDVDALTIRAQDVDQDDDLDIVVSSALSRQTVGVWLNNGHGRFTETNRRTFPSQLESTEAVDTFHQTAELVAVSPHRRGPHIACLTARSGLSPPPTVDVDLQRRRSETARSPLVPVSRGPPATSAVPVR